MALGSFYPIAWTTRSNKAVQQICDRIFIVFEGENVFADLLYSLYFLYIIYLNGHQVSKTEIKKRKPKIHSKT